MNDSVNVQGEFFLHRYLWLGAETLPSAETRVLEHSDFPRLASMLLTYFAFEAFLNDLGARVAPETWRIERDFFSQDPYRGTLGKLDFLVSQLSIEVQRGARPYQTIVELDRRRDSLVHPRTERFNKQVPADKATAIIPDVMTVASKEFLARCRTDVAAMANLLQETAYNTHGPGIVLFAKAFEGTIGYQNTWLPGPTDKGSAAT